jgi:hypothetical protein
VRFDLRVPELEEMSRDELIVVVRSQAGQITTMAGQLSELVQANETLAGKLAKLEHLLSRNSGNSSSPPSKDDDPGKPAGRRRRSAAGVGRSGSGASSPVRRDRICCGLRTPMTVAIGSPKAAVTAVMIWVPPGIWASWTATSSTRSRRSP